MSHNFTVRLPKDLSEKLANMAKAEKTTRSALIIALLQQELDKRQNKIAVEAHNQIKD